LYHRDVSAFPPEVFARLRALAWRGAFEAHLTVEADFARKPELVALCAAAGARCLWIELARGAHRVQPMTSSRHVGALADALVEIDALHARLVAARFAVVRVKLEADASAGVPVATPGGYYELHVRLALASEPPDLRALCERLGAHLSTSDRAPGERFVTARAAGDHERAFAAVTSALAAAGHRAIDEKLEYTLYDDRVALDAGWLA
jgi:hypothetical protein